MRHLCALAGITLMVVIASVLRATDATPLPAPSVASPRPATAPTESIYFATVDVIIDSKDLNLAAYQFEFVAETGDVKIVGIEGGEHPAFAKVPPYYDPAALQEHRVIVASYSTDDTTPVGKTRVARLHVAVYGEVKPHYAAKLEAAASADGTSILKQATISILEGAAP